MSSALDQASAISTLPPDLAILKLENESIQSLAAARPRNYETIKQELIAQLDAYPSFARGAIYNKPVGSVQELTCKNCGNVYEVPYVPRDGAPCPKCEHWDDRTPRRKKTTYARNLSIRAAEAIAEAYGFCRVRCDVTPIDDNSVKVEATFTDYQKGRIWQDAGIVSKFYTDRFKKLQKIPDDRFYSVVVKAEASRRIREVIIRSVPPGLRSELFEMAERKIDELLDDTTIDKIVGQFATMGVSIEQLETKLGRTRRSGWTKEDRRDLLGIWNAIKDGEITVAAAFADDEEDAPPKSAPAPGPVKADDLAGNGARRDPTGAHADLPANHGRTPEKETSPPLAEAAPPPSDDDILTDTERELSTIDKLSAATDFGFSMSQKYPHLKERIDGLVRARKDDLRATRPGKGGA